MRRFLTACAALALVSGSACDRPSATPTPAGNPPPVAATSSAPAGDEQGALACRLTARAIRDGTTDTLKDMDTIHAIFRAAAASTTSGVQAMGKAMDTAYTKALDADDVPATVQAAREFKAAAQKMIGACTDAGLATP